MDYQGPLLGLERIEIPERSATVQGTTKAELLPGPWTYPWRGKGGDGQMSIAERPKQGLAYVTMPRSPSILVPERDLEKMKKRGWVLAHDYVKIPGKHLVYEVDNQKLTSTAVGLVSTPAAVKYVAKYARTGRQERNPLLRLRDIMGLAELSRRTGRTKPTIVGKWMKHDDFPAAVITLGRSSGWYWPDVQAWMESRGMRVTKKRGE